MTPPVVTEQCALAVPDRDAAGNPILRCTSMHPQANPRIPGETFRSAPASGEVSVLLKICPGFCSAFVAIDPTHGHIFDSGEER